MKKRYLGMLAAAILAVAPVGSSLVTGQSPTVQAGTKKKVADVQLIKKQPYIIAHPGDTPNSLSKQRFTDLSSNYGHIITNEQQVWIFPLLKNGKLDYDHPVVMDKKLKAGKKYGAILYEVVEGIGGHSFNRYVDTGVVDHRHWWEVVESPKVEDISGDVCQIFPVRMESNKKTNSKKTSTNIKINKRGYIKVKKNKKVKTYTATGHFSKHYVYGHHTYKLNSKKTIKGKTYYKVSGKNYWIPSTKLVLK